MAVDFICVEDAGFEKLITAVIEYTKQHIEQPVEVWISKEDCMSTLGISSNTTLQKLRDEGEITFTYVSPKIILYHRGSIEAYLKRKSIPSQFDES